MATGSLQAEGLGKRFPGVTALADVALTLEAGRVLALVGANGAGKSTLIKILTGYYETYDGQIAIDGRPAHITTPAEARAYGIQAVYQEVDTVLVPTLTVGENLLLGAYSAPDARPWVDWRALHTEARGLLERIGLDLDPRRRVESLVLHEKQLLVIARAVSQKVRFLIFDEPTTSLGLREIDRLFTIIRGLKESGIGILYISHRLREVADIADEIAVLRGGRKVAALPVSEFDTGRISAAMLGTAITDLYPPKPDFAPGAVVLAVEGLTAHDRLHDLHFSARAGEIVGVAGLVGAGKTELLRVLFGADPIDGGTVRLDGRVVTPRSPREAVAAGIYLVPEERRTQGVLLEETIEKNMTLPFLRQFTWAGGLLARMREHAHAVETVARVGLTPPDPTAEVGALSGGNQQKVAIGKWLAGAARVMLFDEATQGIDIGAKHDIYVIARRLTEGAAVLFASSDIDEIVAVADRAIVMRDGRIVAHLTGAALERTTLLEYATGARPPQTDEEQ